MKLTLLAEINNDILFALPHSMAEDTAENGWLFPEIKGFGSFSFRVCDAVFNENGLLIIPKQFGSEAITLPDCSIDIEICPVATPENYRYRNLPIGGGGYVTGFAFDEDGYLFCRTDIGGCYSCAPPYTEWKALSHNADMTTEWLCNPLALTCHSGKLYVLFGNHTGSFVGISDNKGESFTFIPVPAFVHGNCGGRSTGERIAVTSCGIFIGTRGSGLLFNGFEESSDKWSKIGLPCACYDKLYLFNGHNKAPREIFASDDITLVHAVSDDIIIVGTASDNGVFVSYDGGKSFSALPDQPLKTVFPYISQRCAVHEDYLFITYSATASDRSHLWYSYACDGSKIIDGKLLRYRLIDGHFKLSGDITPPVRRGGLSGVDVSSDGKALVCTTVCGAPDCIFLSNDMGESWIEILTDKTNAVQKFHTPYLRHENNNGQSVIHWTSDIKINPLDKTSAYINTGTGVFCTRNLGEALTIWEDFCEGIEETVHLNIYSPPSGKVRVIDVVGDLGGFAFTDINKECDFTFRDENGNRYITAINADFAEKRPEIAVISPRGNWIGTSKGGAAISEDGGINWRHLPEPYGISQKADALLKKISQPNVNPGWVAVSCDGEAVIRQIADGRRLPADCACITFNNGESWSQIIFENEDGSIFCSDELCVKIFSDRISEDIFYAFGSHGELFISHNKGRSFTLTPVEGFIPSADFSSIEGHGAPDIRVSPFSSGELLLCFTAHGVFTLRLRENRFICERLIPEGDCSCALCGGYGKGQVIYLCGVYKGEYGFWRSYNKSWVRINDEKTQFGQIRSICGDPRAYGRFYIATGSFGSLYGEIDCQG